MRKTMPKTAKKPTRSKLVKKLDVIFSQFIRLTYADSHGMVKCFTCEKRDHFKSMQCGHFMSRKHYSTRWDENNCRVQCAGCNVFRSGMAYEFSRQLGEQLAEEMYFKSKQIVKFTNDELIEKIDHYTSEVKKMT